MGFNDIINKCKKDWDCPGLMDSANALRSSKLPFSSPLMNYATYGGIPRNRITEFFGEPNGGKALPMYANLLAADGSWIKMCNIKVGDHLIDGCGKECKVDGVYPQGVRPVYRLHFDDRTHIDVSIDHLNVVWRKNRYTKQREDYCITTQELLNMYVQNSPQYSKIRVDIPCVSWSKSPVPVDPYLLGVLIGDGSLTSGNFGISNSESDILSRVDRILRRDWGCYLKQIKNSNVDYTIQNLETWYPLTIRFENRSFYSYSEFKAYLTEVGYPDLDYATIHKCAEHVPCRTLRNYPKLANIIIQSNEVSGRKRLMLTLEELGLTCKSIEKHIPNIYLYNSYDVRQQLLQGLFDTDGTISKYNPDPGTTDINYTFNTSSPQLSEDFAYLVRSLGICDTIVATKGKYTDQFGNQHIVNTSYTHNLKVPNNIAVFSSDKHSTQFRKRQKGVFRTITNIEYIGDVECQCIHVDSPQHTFLIDNFTPTHNTTTAVDICKNAIEVFQQEYEKQEMELRAKADKGDKTAKVHLEELIDRGPKKVLYIDLEHTFDGAWAKVLGIDTSVINVMQPPDIVAEDLLNTLSDLIETGEAGLVVIDSLPSLVPRAELEKKFGERTVASLAGLLTIFCRKVVPLLSRYECTMIFINQLRDNMDNPYVMNTPGGRAPKFYAALRIYFKIGSPVDFLGTELPNNAENPAGYIINAKLVKQKSAPFDRKNATYYLMCSSGLRPDFDFAQLAVKKYGIIKKGGAWFTMCDPYTGEVLEDTKGNILKVQGMAKVYDFLQANSEYYKKLQKYIIDDINGTEADYDVADDASDNDDDDDGEVIS